MLLKTFHSIITVTLSWQLGAIGLQTSLGQARPYLGNTDVLILHGWWESLTMHCGHFIPAASLPANSALLWQSLCILLSSLCLPYLCFSGCQLSQRKGVIQAWNMLTVPFQEQFFQRPTDNDPSLVCYQLEKQRLFFPISAFFPSDFESSFIVLPTAFPDIFK